MRGTHDIWTDLADRESDGLGVTLFWSAASDRMKVVVDDSKLDESFELDVRGADALSAFYHPFAYAAPGATRPLRASPTSTDLQLQS